MKKQKSLPVLLLSMVLAFLLPAQVIFVNTASAVTRTIIFPVVGGGAHFSNDYSAPRGSRLHNAIDILADKGAPLVAVASGTIIDVQYPQPTWGWSVSIRDDDNYTYTYIHMNDDNPGTNDGKGGAMNAYAPYVKEGNRVTKGQLIGKNGDSGHSNGVPHLHFEMYMPDGSVTNPYSTLVNAKRIASPIVPPKYKFEILPFGEFRGGASLAMGNIDADASPEVVVGGGVGAVPHVRMYERDNVYIGRFSAFSSTFRGGIDVAAGDIDGDGTDEIIAGRGPGAPPYVKIFEPDGTQSGGFYAFDEAADREGLRLAAGDVDGDGTDEIIASLQAGAEPWVRIYKIVAGNAVQLASFNAYSLDFRGGVDVAVGDVGGATPAAEIVTSPGAGSPHVKVFDGLGNYMTGFLAHSNTYRGGVRVSVGNVRTSSPKEEILTVRASAGGSELKMWDGTGSLLTYKMMFEPWWIGYFDVAAGYGTSRVVAGINRRVSVQVGF